MEAADADAPGQMDIVGGVWLVNPVTGEAKVVTAVDDHSQYCVIAKVVDRATARVRCRWRRQVRRSAPRSLTS